MNEETLILYYYGDGLSEAERAAVTAVLDSDPVVRERYRALSQTLDGLREPPPEQAPADAVGRWHRAIAGSAARERAQSGARGRAQSAASRRVWHIPSFAWGGAVAAAVMTAVGIGFYLAERPPTSPPMANRPEIEGRPAARTVVPASFTRGLEFHLRLARQEIAGLTANDDADRAKLVMDIVRQNRLFERTAHEHDAEDVARVLRAFEPVLLRLAGGANGTGDIAELRSKLEFELDVMLTKMQRRESNQAESI